MKCFLSFLLLVAFASAQYGPQCPPNEVFLECGTACEPGCELPRPDICTLQCIVNVCQCAPGFVRGPDGCVLPEQCYGY
ncbi:unnamed protein product [Caenorhabditis sp. 36 PRJEB53466]|nr:unnamed protein product [Caenorhabditis sp. 36 PRJEB53466]